MRSSYLHRAFLRPFLYSLLLFAAVPPGVRAQPEARIYMDSTAQTIRGFGAAFIHFWRPPMSDDAIEAAFGNGEGQLGLSILRLGIDPDPSRWSENLNTAKKAHELGAIVFASPWNAPPRMEGSEGGIDTVRYDMYAAYAAHLDSFVTYMEANGVPIYAVSVQNEPDYSDDWTRWSPEGMLKFMREHAASIGTRVMAPESFQFRREMSDPLLLDPVAAANLDIVAGHIYGGGNGPYPLAEEKGKEVWMTEYLLNLNTGNSGSPPWSSYSESAKWEETLEMLNSVQTSMRSNMNAYVWWYLERYYSFLGDGTEGTRLGQVLKRGYAFSHFSKFIRPGYTRIHADRPIARGYIRVSVTAYRGPAETVIVAINGEDAPKEVSFVLDDVAAGTFRRYVTSVTQDVERGEDVALAESRFTTTLPARSVTTFVSDDLVGSAVEAPAPPASSVLLQNYPNPFSGTTTIRFTIPQPTDVTLKVYDMLGREVATLVDGRVSAGSHEVGFDAAGLTSGLYTYRLQAGGSVRTQRMALIR